MEAIREAHPEVPSTSDYVMTWWAMAADLLQRGAVSRFGFVTTNKITQPLNRKVVERWLGGDDRINIIYAIPDHPWADDAESADVRIAMSVCERSRRPGVLITVNRESTGEDGLPLVELETTTGCINSDLTVGVDLSPCVELTANRGIAIKGFELGSQGFLVPRETGDTWLSGHAESSAILRPYMNGDDLKEGRWNRYVIDFFGLTEQEAREHAHCFQHAFDRVVTDRATNREQRVIRQWWLFRRSGTKLRNALLGLHRFIGTTRTAKYRVFQFLPLGLIPESKIVVIASGEAWLLGILSSRVHVTFATRIGGWLGVGNDPTYNHTDCFNKFPFPTMTVETSKKVAAFAESLDAHRKGVISGDSHLTITDLYNVLEKLRTGEPLSVPERAIHEEGLVSVLRQIHDDLDRAVFDAYGWPHTLSDDEILRRLVELNQARAAEERRGIIRWLRPEFQNPRPSVAQAATQGGLPIPEELESPETANVGGERQIWPKSLSEQAQAVRQALASRPIGATPEELARSFTRSRADRVAELLETLTALGQARALDDGRYVST